MPGPFYKVVSADGQPWANAVERSGAARKGPAISSAPAGLIPRPASGHLLLDGGATISGLGQGIRGTPVSPASSTRCKPTALSRPGSGVADPRRGPLPPRERFQPVRQALPFTAAACGRPLFLWGSQDAGAGRMQPLSHGTCHDAPEGPAATTCCREGLRQLFGNHREARRSGVPGGRWRDSGSGTASRTSWRTALSMPLPSSILFSSPDLHRRCCSWC